MQKNHKMSVRTFSLICILVIGSLACIKKADQSYIPLKIHTNRATLASDLENLIPKLMDSAMVPGLSIAVIRDADILYHRGFGVKNTATNEPVTDSTFFEAASLSKPIFACAVMKMVEAGQLDLDTPLIKYASESYIEETFLRGGKIGDERIRHITPRMVLSHTPGFPNWRSRNTSIPIQFEPGEKFSYSGEGFVLLQRVVEHMSGMPLDEYMTKNILHPLGMENSSYVWTEKYDTLSAKRHNLFGEMTGKSKPSRANAAASLHTTAVDYAKFVIAIMNDTGLLPETTRQMLSPQIKVNSAVSDSVFWGLGWGIEQTNDGPAFWHWGDNGDFKCFIVAFKEAKIGVVFLTNGANGLGIVEDIVLHAVGGNHPAFASPLLSEYERYDPPSMLFARTLCKEGVTTAIQRYRSMQKDHGEKPILNESFVNQLGYTLLRSQKTDDAIEVFKLNVELYPESYNVYDSLGEAYAMKGEKELAIENYEKSIELNPENTNGIDKLKELKGGE